MEQESGGGGRSDIPLNIYEHAILFPSTYRYLARDAPSSIYNAEHLNLLTLYIAHCPAVTLLYDHSVRVMGIGRLRLDETVKFPTLAL